MVKIGELNRINVAAQWTAEQLGDDGYTTDYLLDLGIRRELTLQAAIPTGALIQPKKLGLNMVFFDGVVDLDSLDCRALQAQGSIKVSEVESKGVLRQLDRTVTITYDDVRIKKDVLERYVANNKAALPVPVAKPPDTTGMVAWQAAIIENLNAVIISEKGDKTPARHVLMWCRLRGPRDVFPTEQPNERNTFVWRDKAGGGLHTVQLGTVNNVWSGWRKAGKLTVQR